MNVLLSGLFHHSGGYSELTRNIALALKDLGVLSKLQILDEKNFHDIPYEHYCSKEFLELEKELGAKKDSVYNAPDVFAQVTPPFMFKETPTPGMKNIGFTMFETRVPNDWFEPVNKVDVLALHDNFQHDLFKHGATKPKLVNWTPWVSNPMNTPQLLQVAESYKEIPKFLFTVGVARVHKNQSKVIDAFRMIRGEFPGLKLVIKAIVEDQEYDDYRERVAGDPDIRVIPGNYSTLAMDNLYQNCAAYVSASMCEGLDMPAIKAAMCGKPVIAGWHTGHMSWVPESHVSLVTKAVDMSTIKNIHPRYREADMRGFDCDVVHLAAHMRSVLTPGESAGYMINTSNLFTREACKNSLDNLLKAIA